MSEWSPAFRRYIEIVRVQRRLWMSNRNAEADALTVERSRLVANLLPSDPYERYWDFTVAAQRRMRVQP